MDNINMPEENNENLLIIDKVSQSFEATSGAIFNQKLNLKMVDLVAWEGCPDWSLYCMAGDSGLCQNYAIVVSALHSVSVQTTLQH